MPSSNIPFRVLKFGGAALRDGASVRRVCEIISEHGGARPVVIVSALEGVTSFLERLAEGSQETSALRIRHRSLLHQLELPSDLLDSFLRELNRVVAGLRESGQIDSVVRDHLLSFGERMSARIVAAVLQSRGTSATPVDAHDLGLVTDEFNGQVRLLPSAACNVRMAIDEVPGVPVVTGFLAADQCGNLTTLGSNGSDLTALFVAEAIDAEEVQLWKRVAGIQTADPKLISDAQTIDEIGFDEAIELARLGARVLHEGAALEAKRAGISLSIRNVSQPSSAGTRVIAETQSRGPIALIDRSFNASHSILSVLGVGVGEDAALRVLAIRWLQAESIQACEFESGRSARSLSFTVATRDLERALARLHLKLFQPHATASLS